MYNLQIDVCSELLFDGFMVTYSTFTQHMNYLESTTYTHPFIVQESFSHDLLKCFHRAVGMIHLEHLSHILYFTCL